MMLKPDQARRIAALLMETEEEPPPPGLDGLTFGNYRVARLVGVGGMGAVYEAQQDRTGRRVAIKVIRPELISAELSRRFEHEVRVLARLQHPGIAQVYEAGHLETAGGQSPYFAMEFVEGRPLTKYAAEQKLSVRQKLDLFLKVCDAVEHAHRKGVIHRDLKPGNILVDASGQPRILDFGVARATDADLAATTLHTEIGKLIGTLPYMSPEQVSGDPDALDTRSDVYSLGVVLFELLAGKPPYEISRGRIYEAARVIREEEPARLGSFERGCKGDLEIIVEKALQKEKGRRYQAVGELSADVRRHLANEPIAARRATLVYQFSRWARRRKLIAVITLGSVLALAASSGVSAWFGVRAVHAKSDAERNQALAQQRRATAEAVTGFFTDVLTAAGPRQAKGTTPTIKEALDTAAAKLDSQLTNEPEAKVAIAQTIGKTYFELGELDASEGMLLKAIELAKGTIGVEHREALLALHSLALVHMEQGKLDGALAEADRAYRGLGSSAGALDRDTIFSLGDLGSVRFQRQEYSDAEECWRDALRRLRQIDAPREDIDQIRGNLAALLTQQRRLAEAEPLARENMESAVALHGEKSAQALTTMNTYAVLLARLKQTDKAADLMSRVTELAGSVFGPDHPKTLNYGTSLAGLLADQGHLDESEAMYRRMADGSEKALGPSSPQTLMARRGLVTVLMEQKRFAEARPIIEDVVAKARAVFGDARVPPTWILDLGDCLTQLQRYEDADKVLQSLLGGMDGYRPAERDRLLRSLVTLYESSGDEAKAGAYRQMQQSSTEKR